MRAGFGLLVIIFLLIGIGGGAAFGGGVLYGRNTAPKASAAITSAPVGGAVAVSQGVAGGTPSAGGGRGGFGSGGFGGGTTGTIESVSSDTLTVRTLQGAMTIVTLAPDTRILTTTTATRDDLKAGSTVTVLGQTGTGGAIDATSITIVPTGLVPTPQAGAGGQGGGQRGAGGRPTPAAR